MLRGFLRTVLRVAEALLWIGVLYSLWFYGKQFFQYVEVSVRHLSMHAISILVISAVGFTFVARGTYLEIRRRLRSRTSKS